MCPPSRAETGKERLAFFGQFLSSPRRTGAVLPSSRRLAARMVEWIDWPNVRAVVEYGPGTGVFTEHVAASIAPGTKFLAIEANARFAEALGRRHPEVRVFHDSVANVGTLCRREGIDRVDAIVCGLPWASLTDREQTEFLEATVDVLKPRGQFVTFAYLQGLLLPTAWRFRAKLRAYFSTIERSKTVWRNMPPAFVYRCRRGSADGLQASSDSK